MYLTFNVTDHNGERDRAYRNAMIVTRGLCTPGSPRDVGDFTIRTLLQALGHKFNMSDTPRRHFNARRLIPGC